MFDVVGITANLSQFLWLMTARVGIVLEHGQRGANGSIAGRLDVADLATCNAQKSASYHSIPGQVSHESHGLRAVELATRCDRVLYSEAVQRASSAQAEAHALDEQHVVRQRDARRGDGTAESRFFEVSQRCHK